MFFVGDPLTARSSATRCTYTLGALPASGAAPARAGGVAQRRRHGHRLFRSSTFCRWSPRLWRLSTIFKWIYAKDFGTINQIIGLFGIPRQDWLFDEKLVIPALIVVSVWHRVPLNIILYLAALQSVPRTLYEAAWIDGAERWQQFRHVTWPMVTPTTFFVLIITVISLTVGGFDQVSVMTQGNPLNASNIMVFNIWRTAFVYFQMGYASAMAYILFVVVLLFTAVQWWLQRRWVHY